MKFLGILLSFVFVAAFANAQTFTVKKVKGKQAIVQLTNGTFTEGQSVTVGSDSVAGGASAVTPGGGSTTPRDHFVGLSGGYSSVKSGTVTISTLAVDVLYGWNPGSIEYGVLGSFGSVSGGSTSTSSFGIGGKFDYNFTENKTADGIFGVGAQATYGTTSGGSSNATVITISPMASYKWFILGTPTAIRFDGGMDIVQTSVSGVSTSSSNPKIQFGLFTYF